MELGIEGKTALVTGASKGLGLGIATELAREGAKVAISSRNHDAINESAESIRATAFVHDASDVDGIPRLVEDIEHQLGPIDIVILNSGGPPPSPDALSFTLDQWRSAYEMLLLGAVALTQAVLPGMQQRRWGRIVSVSSTVVREPNPLLVLSSAHRSGLLAALKTLSRQVAQDGVTINTLLPGLIATDRARELGLQDPDHVPAIPAGRAGRVEEFAAAAAFLCSERASYITGVALKVDGGSTQAV